jgi:hypothetical protein
MSLLQSPRRPPSDVMALGSHGGRNPGEALFIGAGGFGDEPDAAGLGRELDLSDERPRTGARAGRGPGVLVAAIVASSLTLAGIIMLVRGDVRQSKPDEVAVPAPIAEVVSAPAELPGEPATSEPAPPIDDPPDRVASQRMPAATKAERVPAEVTPAAIAPATPARPSAPSTAAPRPAEPAEDPSAGGLAPGLHLPPPVFDDPPAAPAPDPAPTTPVPSPVDDASDPLPGIEERAPEPLDEPGAATREPAAPGAAAQPTHADPTAPFEHLDTLDHAPARTAG